MSWLLPLTDTHMEICCDMLFGSRATSLPEETCNIKGLLDMSPHLEEKPSTACVTLTNDATLSRCERRWFDIMTTAAFTLPRGATLTKMLLRPGEGKEEMDGVERGECQTGIKNQWAKGRV